MAARAAWIFVRVALSADVPSSLFQLIHFELWNLLFELGNLLVAIGSHLVVIGSFHVAEWIKVLS